MLFSSAIFLFLFLPAVLGIYFVLPWRGRNIFLLFASLLFYTWGEQKVVIILMASTIVDYSCGLLISKGYKKPGLILSLIFNITILMVFKYLNFTFYNLQSLLTAAGIENTAILQIPKIALPIGISFYTFQTMSYTIDVYRGRVEANRNFIEFATYVTMFPQLVAGPIVRYIDIQKQLRKRSISFTQTLSGTERFIIGLAKKMIVANNCAYIADGIFALPVNEISTLTSWLGVIAYTLQIYFDFSAYSDMAIGLGKIFGFHFLENFNYPYISRSIKEFWRRWHISLSTWFRDYLYIPLGGSRVGKVRLYTNLFIVFFITGLWHGASWNFVIWGLFHGTFLVLERIGLERIISRSGGLISHLYTLLIVIIGWVLFRADTLGIAVSYLGKMFSFSTQATPDIISFYLSSESLFALLIGTLFSLPVYPKMRLFLKTKTNARLRPAFALLRIGTLVVLLFASSVYISVDAYNPFIYFRF